MKTSLTKHAKERIREIHALSKSYNGKEKEHGRVLLGLLKKHTKEIEELYRKKDGHFAVEVGDMLVLCHELLLEEGRDPDSIMDTCYNRYRNKLEKLAGSRKKRWRKKTGDLWEAKG